MLMSSSPRRYYSWGFSPPRAEIQRRTRDGYMEYSIRVAPGLMTSRPLASVPRRVKTQIGARRHTNPVARTMLERLRKPRRKSRQ